MTKLPSPRKFSSQAATGAVYDHGAHVAEWTPAGHRPVLWMSARSHFDTEAPIRGGVPICLPWFGSGVTQSQQPAHGFARLRSWQLSELVESTAGTSITYTLSGDVTEAFPHEFGARFSVHFGTELHAELCVTNTGTRQFIFEEALHTYIAVGDIHTVSISGLDGRPYLDKAPGAAPAPVVQQGDITFVGETDRVYSAVGDVVIHDPVWGRRIFVSRTNSANVVVWNPWIAKSAAMPDFGDDEWPGMVCVEGANVLDAAVSLLPGASHTMGYRLRVEHTA